MMDFRTIIGLFDSKADLARRIGEERGVVQRWYDRNSIPAERFSSVLGAARELIEEGDTRPDLKSLSYELFLSLLQTRMRAAPRAQKKTKKKAKPPKRHPRRARAELEVA